MASSVASGTPSQETVDNKIMADLAIVVEKVELCESMLHPGAGDPTPSMQDETFAQVVGFLQACAPRMVELVDAATQGALSESVLMKCLEVNDRLTKAISDVDTAALTETPASTTVASAPASGGIEDLLFDDTEVAAAAPPPAAAKTTGEDLLGLDFGQPTAAATTTTPALGNPKSDDEFDSFFNERTKNG